MIRYVTAWFGKFGMTLIVLWIIGFIFNLSFGEILWTSILLCVASFLGDVYLFPKIGHVLAAIGDFVLAFVLIWLIGANFYTTVISYESFAMISAAVLTILEIIFHLLIQQESFIQNQ